MLGKELREDIQVPMRQALKAVDGLMGVGQWQITWLQIRVADYSYFERVTTAHYAWLHDAQTRPGLRRSRPENGYFVGIRVCGFRLRPIFHTLAPFMRATVERGQLKAECWRRIQYPRVTRSFSNGIRLAVEGALFKSVQPS